MTLAWLVNSVCAAALYVKAIVLRGWLIKVNDTREVVLKRILRVFPRRTKATPIDTMSCAGKRFGMPGLYDKPGIYDEIHISVAFTQDIERAVY